MPHGSDRERIAPPPKRDRSDFRVGEQLERDALLELAERPLSVGLEDLLDGASLAGLDHGVDVSAVRSKRTSCG